jgi:hypothetical protein
MATVASTGGRRLPPAHRGSYAFALRRVQGQAGAQPTEKDKLLMYARQAMEMVQEIENRGLMFSYAIRRVGSAVRQQNGWRFSNLRFCTPTQWCGSSTPAGRYEPPPPGSP